MLSWVVSTSSPVTYVCNSQRFKWFTDRLKSGGTAGCVLASRLSENPEVSVLLLERGPVNDTWMSRIPIVSSNILRSDGGASSWLCEPMKYCNDRRSLFFCGEIMGGGSRINSMVYTRGTATDYNAWAAMGHPE